jgi:hypothetical protein
MARCSSEFGLSSRIETAQPPLSALRGVLLEVDVMVPIGFEQIAKMGGS